MSESWTYRLEDFLLFSPRVYWRMFELHNAALWPMHVLTLAASAVLILLALRRPRHHGRWIALALALMWIFVGWSFLWERYAAINWAVVYAAPGFGLQALLLGAGAAGGGIAFDRNDVAGRLGLLFALFAVAAYPLLAPLFGRPWTGAEVFGIAPEPTAIATLGLLLRAKGGLVPLLFPVPLLWLLLSGLTLRTMGEMQAWIPFSAAVLTMVLLAVRRATR